MEAQLADELCGPKIKTYGLYSSAIGKFRPEATTDWKSASDKGAFAGSRRDDARGEEIAGCGVDTNAAVSAAAMATVVHQTAVPVSGSDGASPAVSPGAESKGGHASIAKWATGCRRSVCPSVLSQAA